MNAIKLIVLKPSIDFLSNLKEKTKKFKKGKKRHRLLCGFWIFNDNFLLFFLSTIENQQINVQSQLH